MPACLRGRREARSNVHGHARITPDMESLSTWFNIIHLGVNTLIDKPIHRRSWCVDAQIGRVGSLRARVDSTLDLTELETQSDCPSSSPQTPFW